MATTAQPHEIEHFRDRVRLYIQVILIIDICAHVSDVVTPLLLSGHQMSWWELPLESAILRSSVTVALVAGWLLAKYSKPRRPTLIAIESGVTIGLGFVYVRIALAYAEVFASHAPAFALLGILLLLTVRASLVPSPVRRTVVVGTLSVACLFVGANAAIRALDRPVVEGLVFIGGAVVLVTAVTSHVIYSLRREVRQALRLGQYTLEEKLGEGGMGTVYRARHAMLRRQAAIKLIRPELSGSGAHLAQARQRFEREAHVTANLKSPHTIQLYDFGVSEEGSFYYVMELLDGVNLEVAVEKCGPMPPERVVYLLRQVCESLEEAHAAGLVHRDIKPANIFLCRHGLRYDFAKVLDFGLVALGPQSAQVDQKLTADGIAGGTPAYLAPEIAVGADAVDSRADVYAIGCVAYWLLAGHPPFERETPIATILAHVNETPLPPSSVCESVIPQRLEALVLECLEKRPEDRPPSATELSRRFEATEAAGSWDQERAARWWEAHVPAREDASPSIRRGAAVRVTRASR